MNNIYGIIIDNRLYSNRIDRKLFHKFNNGVYSIDTNADNLEDGLQLADISDATRYFRKSSKTNIVKGISFKDGFIPENPVAYKKLPIKVIDPTYDEFEEIEVISLKNDIFYFLQTINSYKSYILIDLKDKLSQKQDIKDMKGVTPEMRLAFTFHLIEMRKREEEDPINSIKNIMSISGAQVSSVRKTNIGFEVIWSFDDYTINTLLDKQYRVLEAGFCVSGYDKTQSARSVVNLLKDYVEEGSFIHKTRTF